MHSLTCPLRYDTVLCIRGKRKIYNKSQKSQKMHFCYRMLPMCKMLGISCWEKRCTDEF